MPISNIGGRAPQARELPADLPPAAGAKKGFKPFGEDGLTFRDLLDVINPLQHIPILGSLYRRATGHSISPVSRIMGGALFGGVIGAVASVFNAVVEQASGKDLGDQVLAAIQGQGRGPGSQTLIAGGADADSDPTAGALVARRGGWMVQAALGGRPAPFPEEALPAAAEDHQELASVQPPAPTPMPGGWMVNAALRADGLRSPPTPELRTDTDRALPSQAAAAQRRGGWMVNAAHAALDAYRRDRFEEASAALVDVSA